VTVEAVAHDGDVEVTWASGSAINANAMDPGGAPVLDVSGRIRAESGYLYTWSFRCRRCRHGDIIEVEGFSADDLIVLVPFACDQYNVSRCGFVHGRAYRDAAIWIYEEWLRVSIAHHLNDGFGVLRAWVV